MSGVVGAWWRRGGGVPGRVLQGGSSLRTDVQRLQEACDVRRGGGVVEAWWGGPGTIFAGRVAPKNRRAEAPGRRRGQPWRGRAALD